jgi:hypothetical protein
MGPLRLVQLGVLVLLAARFIFWSEKTGMFPELVQFTQEGTRDKHLV